MIVYDKEQKQIVIPNGLGNVNITINQGGECNLGIGEYSFSTDDEGNYELYAENDGYDGWSKMLVNIYGSAIRVWRASELLDRFNNGESFDYGRNYYVGGIITEIQEVIEDCYKTYVLDNGLKIYRGGWFDGICFDDFSKPIKVGSYVEAKNAECCANMPIIDANVDELVYAGDSRIKFVPVAGLEGTNKIVAAPYDALVYATDVEDSEGIFKMWFDEKEDKFLFKVLFTAGTAVKYNDEVVLWSAE